MSKRATNHDMAKLYIQKCKILGKDIFDLELQDGDNVVLKEVKDKESGGKCVIPPFITKLICAFEDCVFEEIYVENKAGVDISCEY